MTLRRVRAWLIPWVVLGLHWTRDVSFGEDASPAFIWPSTATSPFWNRDGALVPTSMSRIQRPSPSFHLDPSPDTLAVDDAARAFAGAGLATDPAPANGYNMEQDDDCDQIGAEQGEQRNEHAFELGPRPGVPLHPQEMISEGGQVVSSYWGPW